MANFVPNTANVAPLAGAQLATGTIGETGGLTKGEFAYLASDGLYWLADASVDAATARVRGQVYEGGAAAALCVLITGGPFNPGTTTTTNELADDPPNDYVLSATAGDACLITDLVTGDRITHLFYPTGPLEAYMRIIPEGIVVP